MVKLDKIVNGEVIAFLVMLLLAGCVFSYVSLYKVIDKAEYLKKARITFYVSPDTKWDELPPFLKEKLARETMSKANLKDLIQIRDMYSDMILNYKEPVNIGEKK